MREEWRPQWHGLAVLRVEEAGTYAQLMIERSSSACASQHGRANMTQSVRKDNRRCSAGEAWDGE